MGPEGGAAIAAATQFTKLRYMRLSGNRLGAAGMKAVTTAPWLATVRELHLFDNQSGKETRISGPNGTLGHFDTGYGYAVGADNHNPLPNAYARCRPASCESRSGTTGSAPTS